MLKLGTVSLDGTWVHANASRHSAMSYSYAKKVEAKPKAEVAELMKRAEAECAAQMYGGAGVRLGQIKHVMKFGQFLLHGISDARGESSLVCLAWNLKRMNALGARSAATFARRDQSGPHQTASFRPCLTSLLPVHPNAAAK